MSTRVGTLVLLYLLLLDIVQSFFDHLPHNCLKNIINDVYVCSDKPGKLLIYQSWSHFKNNILYWNDIICNIYN